MSQRVTRVTVEQVVLEGVPAHLHDRVVSALTDELRRLAALGPPDAAVVRTVTPPSTVAEHVGIAAARAAWGWASGK